MQDLTDHQRQALEGQNPLRLRDPRTDHIYVLVPSETYDELSRNRSNADGVSDVASPSKAAFLLTLPSLLKTGRYEGWYVAYRGNEQIKLHPSEVEVIRECLKRGLKRSDYYLGAVVPHDPEGAIENSLYEFEHVNE